MKNTAISVGLLTLGLAWSASVMAYPGGVTGVTNKSGGSGCSGCHSGSSQSIVSFSGPSSLKVGQTGTYTLTINSGTLIGVDIAVSSGTLVKVTSGLKVSGSELTHSSKLSGTSVSFTYTPTSAGTATMYGTGAKNSKNGGWGHAPDYPITVTSGGTAGVAETGTPLRYVLLQNYPNPFNPVTTIRYSLPHRSTVLLTVFNALGQAVAELENGEVDAGNHEITFDATAHASGVYFYRLSTGSFTETRKMILSK